MFCSTHLRLRPASLDRTSATTKTAGQRFTNGLQSLPSNPRHAVQSAVVGGGLQIAQGIDAKDRVDGGGRLGTNPWHRCQFLLGAERGAQLIQQRRATRLAESFVSPRDRSSNSRQSGQCSHTFFRKNLLRRVREESDRFRSRAIRLPTELIGRLRIE